MSALLLRLFQSEHFSLQDAVSYLRDYADSIGVTAYLVGRLQEFPDSELEFYWPQLCHLLITRPTESVALENLVMQRCEVSTHLAMLTLWYLQASLADLQKAPTSPAFHICRRALNRVQGTIFSDHLPSADASSTSALGIEAVAKILPHAHPVFVGLGMAVAAIALPALAQQVGSVPIAQGRRHIEQTVHERRQSMDEIDYVSSSEDADSDREAPLVVARPPEKKNSSANGVLPAAKREPSYAPGRPLLSYEASPASLAPTRTSIDRLRPRKPMPASQSASSLSSRPQRSSSNRPPGKIANANASAPRRAPSATDSPVAARTRPTSPPATHPQSASVPVLSLAMMSTTSSSSFTPAPLQDFMHLASALPRPLLVKLLRSYACRTQLDLLTSLQDISTRLVLVPKPARISALRAELTVLNHRLPRGCCLCLGCAGEGKHHRVVRISPSEAVVLNSADRAPFLLQVEVLEEDLDFEPTRRQNGEDLRTVLEEREAAIARQSYRSAHPLPRRKNSEPLSTGVKLANAFNDSLNTAIKEMRSKFTGDAADEADSPTSSPKTKRDSRSRQLSQSSHHTTPYQSAFFPAASPPTESQAVMKPLAQPLSPPPDDSEEVDLVEQLYGNISMHDAMPVIEEDAYVAPTIQNRSLDEEAWTRGSPVVSTSARLNTPRLSVTAEHINGLGSSVETPEDRNALTLDQYAERMRMAAVMLAQLSASQQPVIGLRGTATELVGAGVGLGASVVGAALSKLPFVSGASGPNVGGQGEAGVSAKIDATHATSGGTDLAPRHRVLSPADAAAIRDRIMREMMELETERMERMRLDSRRRTAGWITETRKTGKSDLEGDDAKVVRQAVSKDDPSSAVLGESWPDKRARVRAASPYGHLAAWDLISVIVKTGADLRQEQLAVQLIREFGRIWTEASCPHWIRYFRILVTSDSTGLMETITDAVSVHSIKKSAYAAATQSIPEGAEQPALIETFTLYDHFVETFGEPTSPGYRKAQSCFMKSLASYSVISYLLQIKDRHNGNILIDKDGHIIHIDFGFLLSNSPGSLGFEMAPFKLPQDYIDILGGLDSEKFAEWRKLMKRSFMDVRKQAERIIMLVELMQKESNLPCFSSGEQTAKLLRERFQLRLSRTRCDDFVDRLIDSSALSVFTRLYDAFQSYSQGIL